MEIKLWFSVACFGVRVSVAFHRMFFFSVLGWFRLLSGHLWERAPPSVDYMFPLKFDYLQCRYLPFWV